MFRIGVQISPRRMSVKGVQPAVMPSTFQIAQFTITEKTNVGTKKKSAGAFGQVENMAFASTTGVGYAAKIPRAISTNGDATRRTILHYVASNENPMLGPRIRTFNDLIFNFKNTRPYVSRIQIFMENKKMTPGLWPNIGYP